jgi:cell fate regulator YaaT (PSP1 superfamily)
MSIFPLPVFEADADPRHRSLMNDQEIYERLKPPKTIVVKFGRLGTVGEFPYDGDEKPGCGTKLTATTHRGTEVVEMLTTTCDNAGCSKSVTRQELLEYIDNSGGRDFPFHTDGKILHVSTVEELNKQAELVSNKSHYISTCKRLIGELDLAMKLVDVEPILGQELLTFYFMAQERIDFRKLVRDLAADFKTRIEMRQVGARDEARLVADYERCGQHCCCRNFLKVLKPVSMKSAKIQKATLDPLKISGRCGRLMCCLRYEDQTYDQLRKNLPKRSKRVGTSEGPGVVLDTKILVQLVLVRLEHNDNQIAVPVEELIDVQESIELLERASTVPEPPPEKPAAAAEKRRDRPRRKRGRGGQGESRGETAGKTGTVEKTTDQDRQPDSQPGKPKDKPKPEADSTKPDGPRPKRRRRRRRRGGGGGGGSGGGGGGGGGSGGGKES